MGCAVEWLLSQRVRFRYKHVRKRRGERERRVEREELFLQRREIRTLGEIDILGKKLFPSDEQAYKLGLTKFERSASRSEWCGHKSIGELIDDSTDEFLEIIKNL